jgi:FdhE protein
MTPTLEVLAREHPEWRPWLGVVGVVMSELEDCAWDAALPARAAGARASALAHAPDAKAVSALFGKLRRKAIRSEMPAFSEWNASLSSHSGATAVFQASLQADQGRLAELASTVRVDPEAFKAVAALLPMPYLHACRRAWSLEATAWCEGYCFCCGAWPGFVEVRGIERNRYLRCLRCGSSWQTVPLRCAYCGNSEHERLGALLVENGAVNALLEVCQACQGYIKVFNRLSSTPSVEVFPADLESVMLDIAASSRGYYRPPGLGCALGAAAARA